MTKAFIQDTIYWLNAFLLDNGLSDTHSTAEIVQGLPNPDYDKLTIDFVSYVQVHTGSHNNTLSRMIGYIDLRSSGECNVYYFMLFSTEKQLHAFNYTELRIDGCIIDSVE